MATKARADSLPSADEGKVKLDGLPGLLNYQLRMAHVAMFRDFDETMGDLDLTQRLWTTLHLINANPGVSQVDLATTLGTDRATMMAMVDRLEQRGLIVRRRSVSDRRRQELNVTKTGTTVLARAKVAITEHEKHFSSRFTKEEISVLFGALERIHQEIWEEAPNARKGGRAAKPRTPAAKKKT